MTPKQGYILLFVIGTMIAQVEHQETTKKINRLRKQIRLGVTKYHKLVGDAEYKRLIAEAQVIWDSAKDEVEKHEFTISLSLAMVIVYDLLEKPYKNKWFSPRTFEAAIGSLEHSYTIEPDVERSSQWLMDRFSEQLDIPKKVSLFSSVVSKLKG